jgi:hypothetical protein
VLLERVDHEVFDGFEGAAVLVLEDDLGPRDLELVALAA